MLANIRANRRNPLKRKKRKRPEYIILHFVLYQQVLGWGGVRGGGGGGGLVFIKGNTRNDAIYTRIGSGIIWPYGFQKKERKKEKKTITKNTPLYCTIKHHSYSE